MKKRPLFIAFAAMMMLSALLSGCGSVTSSGPEKQEIKIGATAGPYSDQLKKGIKPLLEKKGYKVTIVEFNDYIQPNTALISGSIDANVFQNTTYLENFTKEYQADLTGVIPIPTVPMGLYSKKHRSLDELTEGMRISLPNDPTNQARALGMLQTFGLIKLKADADVLHASEQDITENPKKLEILPLEAAQLPRSLDDVDFSLVNGNFALASGWKLSEAIKLEQTPKNYIIVLTVKTADKDQPFVSDLVEAYKSKEFEELIDKEFQGFIKPEY
ncbi:MetQ/NlpA family ABC transporter substrate-binding protein [Brevibacillus sp. B_LB10_24]|uniref:MetQ/NlpA family ABC transporter substrate-binding protein n=1 Tax=Brevibacillus sp. B_LB10_24 TaxID=3380645 RepID=UPI0038BC36E6